MVSSISSKKQTKTRSIVVKTNSFVRFLEEFRAWQFAFKINWPLNRRNLRWRFLKNLFPCQNIRTLCKHKTVKFGLEETCLTYILSDFEQSWRLKLNCILFRKPITGLLLCYSFEPLSHQAKWQIKVKSIPFFFLFFSSENSINCINFAPKGENFRAQITLISTQIFYMGHHMNSSTCTHFLMCMASKEIRL